MIDARDAAQIAAKYYTDITGRRDDALSIEEIELDDNEENWFITLGIMDSSTSRSMGLLMGSGVRPKFDEYKIFKVSADNGKVKSMKIRSIK